tara:strand:- start:11 stop:118 length:108 start_codon:yes stop_codon:yes gene_type:complete
MVSAMELSSNMVQIYAVMIMMAAIALKLSVPDLAL